MQIRDSPGPETDKTVVEGLWEVDTRDLKSHITGFRGGVRKVFYREVKERDWLWTDRELLLRR